MKYPSTPPLVSRFTAGGAELLVAILTCHNTFRCRLAVHGSGRAAPLVLVVDLGQVTPVSSLVIELTVTELAVYHLLVELAVSVSHAKQLRNA